MFHQIESTSAPDALLHSPSLSQLEIAAVASQQMPDGVFSETDGLFWQLMQTDSSMALSRLQISLPCQYPRDILKAEQDRLSQMADRVEKDLPSLAPQLKGELIEVTRVTGIDFCKVITDFKIRNGNELNLLDLGGGEGRVGLAFEKAFPGVKSFVVEKFFVRDILSKPEVEKELPDTRFINGDMFKLQDRLPKESVDVIISLNTIDLFAVPTPELLTSIEWVLRPGGIFLIDLGVYDMPDVRRRKLEFITPEGAKLGKDTWRYGQLTWQYGDAMFSRLTMAGFKSQGFSGEFESFIL